MPRLFLLLALLVLPFAASATEAGWAQLREGGRVTLIRHAAALGTENPDEIGVEHCAGLRGLSDRGRQQARRMGALFAARAAPVERVLSSRWCRCLGTARAAFADIEVEPLAALDPLVEDEAAAKKQKGEVIAIVEDFSGSGNLVLVTHGDLIEALTGVSPREGEAVIVAPSEDGLRATGRIIFN